MAVPTPGTYSFAILGFFLGLSASSTAGTGAGAGAGAGLGAETQAASTPDVKSTSDITFLLSLRQ